MSRTVGWAKAVTLAAVVGGCGDNLEPDLPDDRFEERCRQPGTWQPLPSVGIAARIDHTAVWTGSEMIVWGGTQGEESPFRDGAAFAPRTGTWRLIYAPIEPRDDHAAVWTGSEMVVWGGNSYDEGDDVLNDGGAYDPASGAASAWRPILSPTLGARDDVRAVWTGDEMIVWGGRGLDDQSDEGARFDPATGLWRATNRIGAPAAREDHVMVWSGSEALIWGGWNGPDEQRNYSFGGRRYDPRTDTWRSMSAVGAPSLREDAAAIWTGTEMIVWGGVIRDGDPPQRHRLGDGGAYDPATDTWRPLSNVDAPSPREDAVVVWTGDEMLVWGGRGDDAVAAGAARYSPAHDRWCPMNIWDDPPVGHNAAGVWTGAEMLVWGGDGGLGMNDRFLDSGGAYRPPP